MKIIPNNSYQDKDENEFCYDIDDASQTVWENIPEKLKYKLEIEDIYFILELEFNFLESVGLIYDEDEKFPVCDYPKDINQDAMEEYIMLEAIQNDIYISYDELEDILDAELIYYDLNGALGDAGEYYN